MAKSKANIQKRQKRIYGWAALFVVDPKVVGSDTLLLVQGHVDTKTEEYIFPDQEDNMFFCRAHLNDVKRQCQKDWNDIGTYIIQEIGTCIVFREKGLTWDADDILSNLGSYWHEEDPD